MPYVLPVVLLAPGVPQSIVLPYPETIVALKVTNRSQYDVQYSNFGVVGTDWIAAGTEVMLFAALKTSGAITFNAVNSIGIPGSVNGVVLIAVWVQGENLPPGTWPVSIPATGNLVATSLVNTTSPNGSQIIHIVPSPNTNNVDAFDVSNNGFVFIGNAGAGAKLELGPNVPLQLDVPASLASGGQPTISIDQILGDILIATNGPRHRTVFDSGTYIDSGQPTGSIVYQGVGIVLNGGTSGTVTAFQFSGGQCKQTLLVFNNFRTAGAAQNLVLTYPYTFGAQIWTGGIGNSASVAGFLLLSGGVSQTIRVLTALALGGGTVSNATGNVIYENSTGTIINAFDTIQFPSGGTSGHTGTALIIGQ